ncbi:glycoside hydrolase family 3 C-terminal domain-containing protein [Hymenobacter psoromatis]|uniref:glycoside hydrolase family 3 C-terminal domain-containing protein n=1 Tax=Hymenobacter psoromatis TaxID=1484116 RepID=UPI001CC0723B|nr:glycoside hydrolase family 3 C-terminal domain-containing protein [Hymenobacter psoromatis]
MKVLSCLLATLLALVPGLLRAQAPATAQTAYPFRNPQLPAEQRIDNILSLLTLEEKVSCLGTNPSIPRLGIVGTGHSEGLHGLALGGPAHWNRRHEVPTTQFPQGYGLGETWDPDLLRQVGRVEGYEARYALQNPKYATGSLVIRAPNADLGRDPRWGRTEECYGEDPFLTGTLAVGLIKGLQGDDPTYWQTAALMKHFLANSNEVGRERTSSNFDERLFHEYYAVPFRMGVTLGGSRAYMASYNAWNGTPMMVNPVLRDVTVDKWGQNGIICTDGGALKLLVREHHYYPDSAWAAAQAVKMGINQFLDDYKIPITNALKAKLLTELDIDRVIRGDFRVMLKLGLLDPPGANKYAAIKDGPEPWLTDQHKAVARLVTQKSIVLLKNEGSFLPLDKSKLKTIAVIGPRADQVLLDWYSGTPPYVVSALAGIKAKVGDSVKITYEETNQDNRAVNAAQAADVAIVVVGNHPTCNAGWANCPDASEGKEAVDRKSLTLSDEALIKQVRRANPRTIVVLVSSFPYAITWTQQNVPAIVHLAQNSQELGNALADVLFGDYNPGGRLTQTWVRALSDLPPMLDYDIRNGRTYQYFRGEPLYPFGFGLSYTTFRYSNFRLGGPKFNKAGELLVSVDVQNTGDRTGDEVVQLYISHQHSVVVRPQQELKGFQRVTLKAQEKRTVQLTLRAADLRYWDEGRQQFILEKDDLNVLVGPSSREVKFQQVVRL